jgi:hypothetical protein
MYPIRSHPAKLFGHSNCTWNTLSRCSVDETLSNSSASSASTDALSIAACCVAFGCVGEPLSSQATTIGAVCVASMRWPTAALGKAIVAR